LNLWPRTAEVRPSDTLGAMVPRDRSLTIARLRSHLSGSQRIYSKIGYGYLAAIGVGLVGSLGGLVVADHFQGRGIVQLADAQTQAKLLGDFERSAERVQLHSARMMLLDDGSTDFQKEQAVLERYIQQAETSLEDIEQFLADEPAWLAANADKIQRTLTHYLELLQQEQQLFQQKRDRVEGDNIADLQAIALALDQQHLLLLGLLRTAQAQEYQAGESLENIQGYEKGIIVTSMLLAAALAGLVAWRTTRAIAQPIETVTKVAQQAALESDFNLRAPITTDDEIGVLAAALNHLIERVQVHTQDLRTAADTAEAQAETLENTLATLRNTQAQLLHAEKMSSLGQMMAGIAHEINNPLGFIHGNVKAVQDYVDTLLAVIARLHQDIPQLTPELKADLADLDFEFVQADLPEALQSMQRGTQRITSIVASLRSFARLQEVDIKPTDLHEGLASTLVVLGPHLHPQGNRPAIDLVQDYGDLPLVECYGGDINQVFVNILGNAIDAINERWHHQQPQEAPQIYIRTRCEAGQVEIAIANNGSPMPKDVQAHAFDPFFTTKPVGKGTGMGLSISYDIVTQKHRGTLRCFSPVDNTGYGAQFTVTLPCHLSPQSLPETPLSRPQPPLDNWGTGQA
jgi:two-component system NtrC family sensor kinase